MLKLTDQFFRRVLPEPNGAAHLNIHWSEMGQNGRKFWSGRACANVEEMLSTLNWLLKGKAKDIYVAMSSQSEMEVKTAKSGATYKNAIRSQKNAVALKSLFIDVDVKEGAYPDTKAAVAALKGFIDKVGLPKPSAMVASGSGGFHVHWALDQDLSPADWQPLANALARATQDEGLLCDSQCTIDSARILRVPGTFNQKTDPASPVKLLSLGEEVSLDEIKEALEPYMGAAPIAPATDVLPKRDMVIADNDELGANVAAKAEPISIYAVAKSCRFIEQTIVTGGKDNPNPLWFMAAAVAAFTEEGREALHEMSSKYPTYSFQETEQLYDRVVAKQKKDDLGWPKCAKIAGYGAKECQGCPLLRQQKSPLNFVTKVQYDKPDPTLPPRYVRDANGLIHLTGASEDGTPVSIPVSHYPFYTGWLSNNPWTFHFETRNEQNRRVTMEVPTDVITGKDAFGKYLGAKGIFATEKEYRIVKEFFVSWIKKLQASKDSVVSSAPFGWSVVDGNIEGFSYAGRLWQSGGDKPAANPDYVLGYQYNPRGSDKIWMDMSRVIWEQDRPALNAILAAGFAGPLVRFTGFPGLILNAYSTESGIGKTTAMRTSQAVWGHPTLASMALNDTGNSALGKMGKIKSLPMYWDEIKSEEQERQFCSIVFNTTGGREKARMTQDAQLREPGQWQTLLVSASNASLIDAMQRLVGSTSAGIHRLFEYDVPPPVVPATDVGAVQRQLGKLEDNFGHAGLIYAKFLGAQHKRIEQEIAQMQDHLQQEVKVRQEERLWVATMTVVMKGAEYANELGLTNINIDGLKKFFINVFADMRGQVKESPSDLTKEMSLSTVLAEFINSNRQRHMLETNRVWVSAGKPPKDAVKVLNDPTKITEMVAQYGREDKILRISSTYLSRWMGDRGYSRNTWTRRMEKEFGLKNINGILGSGTDYKGAKEYLVEIDMNHPKLAQYIE